MLFSNYISLALLAMTMFVSLQASPLDKQGVRLPARFGKRSIDTAGSTLSSGHLAADGMVSDLKHLLVQNDYGRGAGQFVMGLEDFCQSSYGQRRDLIAAAYQANRQLMFVPDGADRIVVTVN